MNRYCSMRKGWKPLDYMFYRLAELFVRKDGSQAIRAIVFLSMMQAAWLLSALLPLAKKLAGQAFLDEHPHFSRTVTTPVVLVVIFLTYQRYSYQFYKIAEGWRHKETRLQRVLRGVIIFLALVSSLIMLLIFSSIRA